MVGYKINLHKRVGGLLYISDTGTEEEIRGIIPFTVAQKQNKQRNKEKTRSKSNKQKQNKQTNTLGVNLTKEVKILSIHLSHTSDLMTFIYARNCVA